MATFKDFIHLTNPNGEDYLVGYKQSTDEECRITLNTLINRVGLQVQYSVDGENWHENYTQNDLYMRQKIGNVDWGDALRIAFASAEVPELTTAVNEISTNVQENTDNIEIIGKFVDSISKSALELEEIEDLDKYTANSMSVSVIAKNNINVLYYDTDLNENIKVLGKDESVTLEVVGCLSEKSAGLKQVLAFLTDIKNVPHYVEIVRVYRAKTKTFTYWHEKLRIPIKE